MRTLRRRLFASVSVLSLILCLATVGLWVRSYWRRDMLDVRDITDFERREAELGSNYGVLGVTLYRGPSRTEESHDGMWLGSSEAGKVDAWFWFRDDHSFELNLPHWAVTVVFALAPTYWLLGPRRTLHRRRKLGLCERCGYDLRATPARCPECGTAGANQTSSA